MPLPHIELYVDKFVYYVQLYNIESYNPDVKNLILNTIKKSTYMVGLFLTVEICECYYIFIFEM